MKDFLPWIYVLPFLLLFRICFAVETSVLEEARALWDSLTKNGTSADYRFRYSHSDLDSSYYVLVTEGVVEGVSMTGSPIDFSPMDSSFYTFPTMEELFDIIEATSNSQATFDSDYGYPTYCSLADAEIEVSNFVPYSFLQTELDKNMQLWNESGSADYVFTETISCYCFEEYTLPKRIEVTDNVIVSVQLENGTASLSISAYYSVLDLFEKIQQGISGRYVQIDVQYDPELGFPAYISLDYDTLLADDEISFTVEEMAVLNSGGSGSPLRKSVSGVFIVALCLLQIHQLIGE